MKRLIPAVALLLYLISAKAYGQSLLPYVEGGFTTNAGIPLAAGKICTTASGTNTNLATYPTYADAVAQTNANANPVVLDAAGRGNIWIRSGPYRIIIYAAGTGNLCNGSAVGTAIKTVDGVASGISVINALTINGVQMCDQYPGSTAGAKIAACISALPSGGGVADARGIQGGQSINSDPFFSVTKSVQLLVSGVSLGINTPTTIPTNVQITMSQGALFSVGGGSTLTVNGSLAGSSSSLHFSGGGTTTISNQPLAPQWFTGADAGAQIQKAVSALPSVGGTINALGFQGAQAISTNLTLGVGKPVELLLNPGSSYELTASSINIAGDGVSIIGGGTGCRLLSTCATIKRTAGTATMISVASGSATHVQGWTLKNLMIEGGGTAGHGIVVDYSDTWYIEGVHVSNGGASNALRLLNDVWDFWITNNAFYVWGDATNPTINLQGGGGGLNITDGHWDSNQLGENGNGNPILVSNANVVQQRFIDNKFHTTGTGQVYMVDWSGYRSDFIGCTFQATQVAATGGLVRFRAGGNNRIVGGAFTDVNTGDAVKVYTTAGVQILGVGFTGASTSAAVSTNADFTGALAVVGNSVGAITTAYDFAAGVGQISINGSVFASVTNRIIRSATNTMAPIDSGMPYTYTPTITNGVNVTSSTPRLSNYSRNGPVMILGGIIDIVPTTAASTQTRLRISPAIASDFTTGFECGGTGNGVGLIEPGTIYANAATNDLTLDFLAAANTSHSVSWMATCEIK